MIKRDKKTGRFVSSKKQAAKTTAKKTTAKKPVAKKATCCKAKKTAKKSAK